MSTIKQILRDKDLQIVSVSTDTNTFKALQIMAENNIGALLVMNEGELKGIFTERDYARKVALKGKTSRDTCVGEMMTRQVFYIEPSASIEQCMSLMTSKRLRHLPVMENNQVIGVVSIGDVVKKIISEQEDTIQQLENYITGNY